MAGKQQTVMLRMIGDNTDLRKKLDASERKLRRFEAQAKKTGRGAAGMNRGFAGASGGLKGMIGPLAGAAAGMVGLTAASDLVKDSLGAYQDLGKASLSLSRTTGMDIETSSAFVSMMKQRGIGANKLGVAFNTLSKKMTDAASGGKKSSEMFATLGVSMSAIERGDTAAVLGSVSDAFANMKDGPEKTALALKLFGRQGAAMVPVLNKGSGALKEQLAEMKDLGLTLGKNGAEDVATYAKSQRKLKGAIEGVKIAIGGALMPYLSKAMTSLAGFAAEARKGKGAGGALRSIVVTLGKGFADAVKAIAPLVTAIGKFAEKHPALMKLAVTFGVLTAVVFKFLKLLRLAPLMGGPVTILIAALVTGAYLIIKNWKTVKAFIGQVWNSIVGAFKRGAGFVVSLARRGFLGPIPFIVANWRKVLGFFGRAWSSIRGFFSSGAERIRSLARRGFLGPIAWILSRWRSVIAFFRRVPGQVANFISSIPNRLRNLAGRFASAGKNLGLAFIRAIGSGLRNTGTFIRNIGRSVANWINDHTPFGNKISLGPISVTLPKLANGGIINGARMAIVGEAGPEAVIPLSRNRRERGRSLLGQAADALGVPVTSGSGASVSMTVHNYGGQMNESVLAARLAWQLQTRGI
jgi:hypothetical protein